MSVIQGGPAPVKAAAIVADAPRVEANKELPKVAVKAVPKAEVSTGPRYKPHSDGDERGRHVDKEA